MSALLARALVFASSAAVLVLEILAGRLVAPYVGITLETFTGIIGIVLAGIALGSWAGGYVADRLSARTLIAPLLLVSGLLTMAIPTVVDTIGPTMRAAGPLEIVVLTLSAFFLPATTLSAIPPIVVKLRLSSLDETGSVVGSLSALGTMGALAGTFLTGFVLVAAAPTRPIVLGIGVLLLMAGIAMSARLAPRRSVVASLIAVAGATGWLATSPGPCDHETTYFCAVIEVDPERPSGRTLWLDSLPHSYVDLVDPTHLEFRYIRTIADLIAARPDGPLDIAYVGGGGFTLPRYVNTVRPGSTAVVFEIDRALVEVVEQHLGLEQSAALRVETGDARLGLPAHADDSFQVVVGDAFGGLSVPWHLTTREFIREVDRVLVADGLYVINVIDFPPLGFARAELSTLRAVFPHVAVIAPPNSLFGDRGGNVVLVGSRQPIPRDVIQARLDRRDDREVILSDASADEWVADAPVLTDDFAPVDQLLTPPSRSPLRRALSPRRPRGALRSVQASRSRTRGVTRATAPPAHAAAATAGR